jgi:hypothetical protein
MRFCLDVPDCQCHLHVCVRMRARVCACVRARVRVADFWWHVQVGGASGDGAILISTGIGKAIGTYTCSIY